MIILRGANMFPTQIEEQVMATGGIAPHFQIEFYKAGRMDAMRLLVEASPDAADDASQTAAARMLTKRVKDIIGVSTEVNVGAPGSIPRSEGKAVRVIDNRKKP